MKFAFWIGLLAKKYDASLWRAAAYRSFVASGGKPRGSVHGRMNAIRRFRNRVAHHEPIFHRDPSGVHDEILEAIGWMCRPTRDWVQHNSRVLEEVGK